MISRGTSQQSSAPYNRRVVLDLIRREGEISRKEIVDQVSLSPQTVANITHELESTGMVISRRRKVEKSRGQPPIVFALNPDGGASIGINLEPGRVAGALVNLTGDVQSRHSENVDTNNPEVCLEVMLAMVAAFEAELENNVPVWGVGVSLPGPFGAEALSFVGPTAFEGWGDLAVLDRLHGQSGYTVSYSTDSVAGALGESLYGAAKTLRDFYYIHFGIGLGGVLVNGHSAYQGATGNATELGHVPVALQGKTCYCGNRGCLERYVSMHALVEYFEARGLQAPGTEEIEAMMAADDPVLTSWCCEASAYLRQAVCFIENTLDPEVIILGGSAPRVLLEKLIEEALPWSHSVRGGQNREDGRVVLAGHGAESAILGAAVLPLYEMMTPRLDVLHREQTREDAAGTLFGQNIRPSVGRL